MKKYAILSFVFILTGAGCSSVSKTDDFFKDLPAQTKLEANVPTASPSTSTALTKVKTPSERGMVGLKIVNAVTGIGIPRIAMYASGTNITFETNINGYVEIPARFESIYLPKPEYYESKNIDIVPLVGKDLTEISLEPEPAGKGYEVIYLQGKVTPSENGGSYIQGYVKRNGVPMGNLNMIPYIQGLNPNSEGEHNLYRTDEMGGFVTYAPLFSGGMRFRFPDLKSKKIFQVDVVEGHRVEVQIDI